MQTSAEIKEERNIKLIIEYEGTNYHGWQSQLNAVSIQDTIEKALNKITKHEISLVGAGRTDAGVHAYGQVANFKTICSIPVDKVPNALNSILPNDIIIKDASVVPEEFHARYSAKGKKYRYIINNAKYPSTFRRNLEYHYSQQLNIKEMNNAVQLFIGSHDFRGFMSAGGAIRDTVRTIYNFDLKREEEKLIFEITGDGFLYNMVRIIVGTLIDVGRLKISDSDVQEALKERERSKAGNTAPPHGLYLVEVYY